MKHVATWLLLPGLAFASGGWAQAWPVKPVRVLLASAAGSPTDSVARVYSPRLAEALGQPVPIDNRPGAGGMVALESAAKAPPDGYTLLGAPGGIVITGPHLYKPIVDIARELEPVAPVSRASMFLVARPGLPAGSVAELVAHARANPGKLNFGSGGSGTTLHIAGVMLLRAAKIDATHVPYKSSAVAATELLSGRIDFLFDPGTVVPHIKSGKLRLLAVARATRSPFFPDAPTMAEAGTDVDVGATTMTGVYAPAGVSRDIVTRVNRELARIVAAPEVRAAFAAMGAEPLTASPEQFAAEVRRERERFGVLIREAGIKAD
jgi:tripartite-type tricarboxylate transporter receptor subunit TctC